MPHRTREQARRHTVDPVRGEYKVPGGKLVAVELEVADGRLANVHLSGDFFLEPDEALGVLSRALDGLATKGETQNVATSIGGPVALLNMLWMSVNAGLWICLGMVRMICVNLAIINLLPFPVLDGGHILFALWEIITRRKPHPKVVSALVNFFAVLLISLMLLLVFKDVWGLGGKKWVEKLRNGTNHVEQVIAPTNSAPEEPKFLNHE